MAAHTEGAHFTFAVKEYSGDHDHWYIMLEPDSGGIKGLPPGFFSLEFRDGRDDRRTVEQLAEQLNRLVSQLTFTDMRGSDDAYHVDELLRNLPPSRG